MPGPMIHNIQDNIGASSIDQNVVPDILNNSFSSRKASN